MSYADEFLPFEYLKVDYRTGEILKDIKSESPILNPNDIVCFFKRLRRYSDGESFKYFYVGEYGDESNTGRPHWHIILHTNLSYQDTLDLVRHAWSVEFPEGSRKGVFTVFGKYQTNRLSMGRVTVSSVTLRRIRYCAKYVVKENGSDKPVPKFARWSKLYGVDWLKSSEAKEVVDNERLYAFTTDGKPASLGRFFTHRLYNKKQYQSLVDRLVFAPSQWPPDCILGNIKKMVDWSRKKQAEENNSIGLARIHAFTNLAFI